MNERFEYIGEWFLPSNKDYRIYGTLSYIPLEGIELRLYGSFEDSPMMALDTDQSIILGITSDSKHITLSDCLVTQRGSAKLVVGEEIGKPNITYSPRYLLKGIHIENMEDMTFNKVSAEIFNLGEWLDISGFDIKDNYEHKTVSVNYKLPQPIEFEITQKLKGKFSFGLSGLIHTRYQKSADIDQKVEFEVESQQEETIEDLLKYIFTFQNLISLALYKSTYPLSISLEGSKHRMDYGEGKIINKRIDLYFSSRSIRFDEDEKLDIEMLFTYKNLGDNPNEIIKNWYLKYEMLEPAFNLLLEQFYNKGFTENTFLNLAQSAETFHVRIHDRPRIPQEEYTKMKNDILNSAPSQYHSWLKEQFNFGNYLNLHSRLTELIEKYSNDILDKVLGDKTKFVTDVKNSRNYYTHYDKRLEKKALKGADLFYLSERLKILLVCAFLMEAGITKEMIVSYLERIKWRKFNHLVDWSKEESKANIALEEGPNQI